MELAFVKVNDLFVAEFEATGNFNLHIEGVYEGNVEVFQKGVQNGEYARTHGATPDSPYGRVYDYDFGGLIFPKYIKVECATQPASATVTFAE